MNDIGLIGLGVMGENLALNIGRNNYRLSVLNRTVEKTKMFMEQKVKDENIMPFYDIKSFVESLDRPRKIILMVKSGEPVDNMICELLPHLENGDLIIDGGNSYFKDTNRRMEKLKASNVLYLGLGISGGEYGALNGPSLMPGGSLETYKLVEDILLNIAAKVDSKPCCTYVGDNGAGHFVKMIHNGIEYGIMLGISEAYNIMKKGLMLSSQEIGDIFKKWNDGELGSYLMEISYKIMYHEDEKKNGFLVDFILDRAEQKGTGKWTSITALELGIPAPSLTVAVDGRFISHFKEERIKLSNIYGKVDVDTHLDKEEIIYDLEKSMLFNQFILFSQGIWLINEASNVYNYNIDSAEVLKIWKGGCIIRAKMIDFLVEVIKEDKENVNLLNNKKSVDFLLEKFDSAKNIANIAKNLYIPALIHNTSIDYFLGLIEENSAANLMQAQRDFFGAHTYERVDVEGVFHTEWE